MSIPTDSERTAPLSVARQAWLSERLAQEPDVRRGRFPFRDTTLARADIEWLLSDLPAAGLDLRGAILRGGDLESLSLTGVLLGLAHRDWVHATQEERRSAAADLSGADLRNARLDRAELSSARLESANLIGARLNGARAAAAIFEHANLSLATCNGAVLTGARLVQATLIQTSLVDAELVDANLTRVSLVKADLRGACATSARLAGATLVEADLRGIDLFDASLEGANLTRANMRNAQMLRADLRRAVLVEADVSGADCYRARLDGATLDLATFTRTTLRESSLRGVQAQETVFHRASMRDVDATGADLSRASFDRADLSDAGLRGASLDGASFHSAVLTDVRLEGASLREARFEGADLRGAHLEAWPQADPTPARATDLRGAFMNAETQLADATFGSPAGFAVVADIRWGSVDLSAIDWSRGLPGGEGGARGVVLGDETLVREHRTDGAAARRQAIRANRQVAAALRNQGLHEDADCFAYRAQVGHRRSLWHQGHRLGWAFSWLLSAVSGYGYRPGRSLVTYATVVLLFAATYLALGDHATPGLSPSGALVLSITALHGRGFSPGGLALDDVLAGIAAVQAVVGLIIELTFIATFTQRFLGK